MEMKYGVFESKEYTRGRNRLSRRGFDLSILDNVVNLLASGERLPREYKDHPLRGDKMGRRECHVDAKPNGDWLLVYKKIENALLLYLVGTGTHVELGLDK